MTRLPRWPKKLLPAAAPSAIWRASERHCPRLTSTASLIPRPWSSPAARSPPPADAQAPSTSGRGGGRGWVSSRYAALPMAIPHPLVPRGLINSQRERQMAQIWRTTVAGLYSARDAPGRLLADECRDDTDARAALDWPRSEKLRA